MESIVKDKPVISILEGGKYNKHDEYVKEEFEILGNVNEDDEDNDNDDGYYGKEEENNNSNFRNIKIN